MSEEELIKKIAELWVSSGGDEMGFDYCYLKIKEKINELIK